MNVSAHPAGIESGKEFIPHEPAPLLCQTAASARDAEGCVWFPAPANTLEDSMPWLRTVLSDIKSNRKSKLCFRPGRYHFWPDQAFEKYLFISNNDEGLKRVAFHLEDVHGLDIEGNGGELIFHGFIIPFVVERSSHLRISGLSIDYARSFHSEGRIISASDGVLVTDFSEQDPFLVENNELVFLDGKGTRYPWGRLLEFDSQRREPAWMALDYWSQIYVKRGLIPADEIGMFYPSFFTEQIGDRRVRIRVPGIKGTPGNVMVFGPDHRLVPCIFMQDTRAVAISDVTIHHSGGMASVFLRCDDVTLQNCRVSASKRSEHIVSATADATHFINCAGQIQLKDCLFENQMDDATNIHGNYATVHHILDQRTIVFRLRHVQHRGFRLFDPGDEVVFSDAESLHELQRAEVSSVTPLNCELTLLTLSKPVRFGPQPGTLVWNGSRSSPEVVITGCVFRGNRARGILLGSGGPTLVENNLFHNPGAAVLLEGDGHRWFEQAAVRDLLIRGNTFENCNFGVWGRAVIEISSPHIQESGIGERCHRNITITGNRFLSFDDTPILYARGVSSLRYYENSHEKTSAYPQARSGSKPLIVEASEHFDLSGI